MKSAVDFQTLVSKCLQAKQSLPESQRLLVALAGAPGSGKSTLSARLVDALNSKTDRQNFAVTVPMDGYHLDNVILKARDLMQVKGSPDTFDVIGFEDLLKRLRQAPSDGGYNPNDSASQYPVYYPIFDRSMDLSRVAAGCVDDQVEIVVLEGNYLLLKRSPWNTLSQYFHLTVMLDVPLDELERRLVQRWLDHGLEESKARLRALTNDIPNAKVVIEHSVSADLEFRSVRQ